MTRDTPTPMPAWRTAPAALVLVVLLTGCGATQNAGSQLQASPPAVSATPAASASPTNSAATAPNATDATPAPLPSTSEPSIPAPAATSSMSMPIPPTEGPSATAQMICSPEIRDAITTMLQLPAAPDSSSTYIKQLYTCTYHLSDGPLVLSVQDTTGVPAAQTYFDSLRRTLPGSQTLTGLASLGLPAFQTPGGTVVFLKDDKTLKVDATALPPTVGPNHQPRTDIAYQVATDVIACWRGQ